MKDDKKPITALALSKALRRSLTGTEKKKDVSITIPIKNPFTPHDLRRTCATELGDMGFSLAVVSALLNHKATGVTQVHYMLYKFDAEKKKAIMAWDRRLTSILTTKKDNVVPMTRNKTA
jgi:integrase